MKPPARNPATFISRALLTASNPSESWTRSLEQTLHQLGCRDSLTPSLVSQIIDPHLLHHPSLSLGFFNWASQQPNFSHTSITYNSLFKSLSISRHFNPLEKLIKQAKSQKICVDSVVYRSIIASRIKLRQTHEAYLLLNDLGLSIYDIGSDLCNSLMAGLVSKGYFECAHKVFDEMLVRGVRLETLGFGLFLWRYSKNAELGQILGVLSKVRVNLDGFNGSIVALLIVHGLCEAGRVSEAYNVLDELRNRGCKPDFIAYRVVAEGFRSKGPGCIFEVQMVLKKKRKLGVAPRANDYGEFILALISDNLLYEAKELGHMIVDGNFPIVDDVLNALIGSISLVDPCSAVSFFKFMVGKDRMPSLMTLSKLSRNLNKHDKVDVLLDVVQTLSSKGYFTNSESYSVMFSSMCEAGRVREAYGVLQEMRKKGLNPDISFYNVLMETLCNEDLIRPAKKLWDEMFAYGVEGNLKTYNILIKKLTESCQVDEAQQLFQHMLRKDLLPDATTYTTLIEGFCRDEKIETAIQVFYKAIDQDMIMAQTLLNPLVLYLCGGGHLVCASRLLCSNSHLRHPQSHAILLKYVADKKQVQIGIHHLQHVVDVSPTLMPQISTEILALLSSSSNPNPMVEMFQEIYHKELMSTNSILRDFCAQLLTWVSGARQVL